MTALALGLVLALAPADTVDAPCPGGDVVSRAALEAAGATTLHDALRLSPALDAVTVDGYDRQPVAPSVSADRVRVLVDGAPAAGATSLEPVGLEALPVALAEVERVVVCPGPGVAAGSLGGAWIDVRTRPPGTLVGAVAYGNETGDPGPDRYLRPGLPNVDHWGPDFEAVAALPGRAAWAALRDRGFFPTDSAIAPRVFDATSVFPARSQTAGALAGRVGGGRVRVGGIRGTDLPFLPLAAREVPVSRRSLGGTASGVGRVGPLAVRGHVHLARLTLDRAATSTLALDPAWTESRLDVAGSLLAPRPFGSAAAGARLRLTDADAPGLDATAAVADVWARVDRRRPGHRQSVTVQGSATDRGAAASGVVTAWRALAPGASVRGTLAAGAALPEAQPDAAYWIGRGYAGLDRDGLAVRLAAARPTRRALARIDVRARRGRLGATGRVEVQASDGDALVVDLADGVPAPTGSITTRRAAGRTVRASLGLRWARRWLALRADARVRGVGGDPAFRSVERRVPAVAASTQATVRPDSRLALWARVETRTATVWAGFPRPDVPAVVLLDLGASKRAWGDRLRVSLSGRNVLGAPEQTHPLGARLAPRLWARLAVRL